MKRVIATLAASLAAAAVSAGTAFAGSPVQSSTQSADTDQAALAASNATQVEPSNQDISVRVLSPGDDGSVTQTNSAASSANAGNTAPTTQTASQSQSPGCGCVTSPATGMAQPAENGDPNGVLTGAAQVAPDPAPAPAPQTGQSNDAASSGTAANAAPTTQTATQTQPSGVQSSNQSADTDQQAAAASSATQVQPSNSNISVRVLSPGNDGSVSQSNKAASSATSANSAPTTQTGQQTQGGPGVQSSTQNAETDQSAAALSEAKQVAPTNSNVSVRVLSPGNDGSVSQTNSAASSANAGNTAPTTQTATQNQGGSCCTTGSGVQSAGQTADTDQTALAASKAIQLGASNDNEPVRIGSSGGGGSVTQSNDAASSATAANSAPTTQNAGQTQSPSCGCLGGTGVQSSTQKADTDQAAAGLSEAKQIAPSNENEPVRVHSPGDDGSVTQSNKAMSSATAGNTAPVTQTASQLQGPSCGCTGRGVQALGQSSDVDQAALAASAAIQLGPSNDNEPVRIGSFGGGGSVSQTNSAASSAMAANTAPVTQSGSQTQAASPLCGCSPGSAIQALGQSSSTDQLAVGLSLGKQIGAENQNEPVGIWSSGTDGSVTQSNSAASSASAGNTATTSQQAGQQQAGSGIQALGQDARTRQAALAASAAIQLPGRSPCGCEPSFGNSAEPVRIWSPGNDGALTQSNSAASSANAGNAATTTQSGRQTQTSPPCGCVIPTPPPCGCVTPTPPPCGCVTPTPPPCGCVGLGVQALGQQALIEQLALALSAALQGGPASESEPIHLWSVGGDGSSRQSNDAATSASAPNLTRIPQSGTQLMV